MERALNFPITGGTAEEVIALDPDLVLASSFTAPATLAALEQANIAVETFGGVDSVEGSAEQIGRIGQLLKAPERAARLASHIARGNGAVRDAAAEKPSLLMWQSGEIVAGDQSLIMQLIEQAGFSNHAAALGLDQADRVSLERVLAQPPDLLLIAGESAGQAHPVLDRIEGMQVGRFDPRLFFCAGPSIPEARRELGRWRSMMVREPDGQ